VPKIAAYQAPLSHIAPPDAIELIRARVKWCEDAGVALLCCPEAILGGLADYAPDSRQFAIPTAGLASVLAPLASRTVTTIVGFTELAADGSLYNSAAVFQQGSVVGVYRKLFPAIRHSVYNAGRETPVFGAAGVTFGIVICNDSNFPEPAAKMAAQGATLLFIPTNNALPASKSAEKTAAAAQNAAIARARENHVWVVRADVAGRTGDLESRGSSAIVSPDGGVLQAARPFDEDLLVAEIA